MKRLLPITIFVCMVLVGCGSGSDQGTESQISDTAVPDSGVPMAKATITEPETPSELPPTETEEPVVPAEPTAAPPEATDTPMDESPVPKEETDTLEVIDLAIEGSEYNFKIFGLIRNNSEVDVQDVWVTLELYDAAGEVVHSGSTSTMPFVIPSGEVSLFDIFFPVQIMPQVEQLGMLIEWKEKYPDTEWTRDGFEVISVESGIVGDNYEVWGELRNAGDLNAPSITIVGLFYDVDGRLIAWSMTHIDDLAAGASAKFSMREWREDLSEIARYELLIEGRY
jgi:hypothetical protein